MQLYKGAYTVTHIFIIHIHASVTVRKMKTAAQLRNLRRILWIITFITCHRENLILKLVHSYCQISTSFSVFYRMRSMQCSAVLQCAACVVLTVTMLPHWSLFLHAALTAVLQTTNLSNPRREELLRKYENIFYYIYKIFT